MQRKKKSLATRGRKLVLNRETIAELSDADLGAANGGTFSGQTWTPSYVTTCYVSVCRPCATAGYGCSY